MKSFPTECGIERNGDVQGNIRVQATFRAVTKLRHGDTTSQCCVLVKEADNAMQCHRTGHDRHNILYAPQQPRYIDREKTRETGTEKKTEKGKRKKEQRKKNR